jgi:transposase
MNNSSIQPRPQPLPLTIGLDLGSSSTQCAVYGTDGKRIEERKISTTRKGVRGLLERFPGSRIVMEASTSSRWIHNLAKELGHEDVIANPRNIPVITASTRKCDRNDARLLAEIGQIRPDLLSPVQLREDRYQEVRTLLFAREQLVKQRAALVTFVRSELKILGHHLPSCGTKVFATKSREQVPASLRVALDPIFDQIQAACSGIATCDARIDELSNTSFPETALLRQVHGIGPLIALAFVATIGDPQRFAKSRVVGAYFGLVPRIHQSGRSNPNLGITKTGDRYMRSLLVSAATRVLGPHAPDTDLRRYGERIIGGGGVRNKGRARIAVARKLAVLLHSLLRTSEVYEPNRHCGNQVEAA